MWPTPSSCPGSPAPRWRTRSAWLSQESGRDFFLLSINALSTSVILSALKLSSPCQDRAVLQRYYHLHLHQCHLITLFPDDKYQEYLWVCGGNRLWSVGMKRLLKARKLLLLTKLDPFCDIWSYLSLWWQLIYSICIYFHSNLKCNFTKIINLSWE